MRKAVALLLALAACAFPAQAFAEFPERPITLIIPHNPGGGAELGARTWQPFFEKCTGQDLVLLMRPGGNAAIGIAETAASKPDGYTFGVLSTPPLVTNTISGTVPYSIDDFAFIGNIIGNSGTINVHKDSNIKSLADLLELIKTSSGPINIGVGGMGADDHLTGLRLMQALNANFTFIPFGDGASARNALLGQQVEVVIMNNILAKSFQEEIRTLAIASTERSPFLPDVPTLRESGIDVLGGSWHVLGAPKDTPPQALAKLRDCVRAVSEDPGFIAEADRRGVSLSLLNPEETEQLVRGTETTLRELWATHPWTAGN